MGGLFVKNADTVLREVRERIVERETKSSDRPICERLKGFTKEHQAIVESIRSTRGGFLGPVICAAAVSAIAIFGICVASNQSAPMLVTVFWLAGIGYLLSLVWAIGFVHHALTRRE